MSISVRTNVDSKFNAPPTGTRVLVLHQHYWPETAATAQILTDLCEDLAADGCSVTVVTGQPSYRGRSSSPGLPDQEVRRGVHIRRVWSYVPTTRNIPGRLLHYGSYFATSLLDVIRHERPDVCVVMSTPPLLLGISGTLLKALRGVPFIYCVQDLYPDIAIHLGVISPHGLTARLVESTASACYRSAGAVVTLSAGMAERLAAKGIPAERIKVVPNWADTSDVLPQARDNPLACELGLAGRFVVQYSGNLGLSQGLECVIQAAELLKALPIRFALIGDGNARPALQREVASRRLTNVFFLPPQPRENLGELLSACDVGLVTMRRGVGSDLVPSKLYGIMAVGRPVLAAVEEESEVARVLNDHQCGWLTEPEAPAQLAARIKEAFEASPETRLAMGDRGRRACVSKYSRKASTRAYRNLVSALLGTPRHAAEPGPAALHET